MGVMYYIVERAVQTKFYAKAILLIIWYNSGRKKDWLVVSSVKLSPSVITGSKDLKPEGSLTVTKADTYM